MIMILENVVLIIAVLYVLGQLVSFRNRAVQGGIILPPVVVATLLFIIFLLVVYFGGWSPFHLLWLFVASFLIGTPILIFPIIQKVAMYFIGLLAMIRLSTEPAEQPQKKMRSRKRKGR